MPSKLTPDQRAAIGDLVRRTRERAKLTIQAASEAAGVSHMTWISVEAGRPVRGSSYAAVEMSFGWPVGAIDRWLETGEEPVAQPEPQQARDLRAAMDDVLESDLPDARKVKLLQALREVEALRSAQGGRDGAKTP